VFRKIDNKTVVEQVVKQIIDNITAGELKPGDRIETENELSEKLGVGRNSVREAIKVLSALGLLKVKRGDGTYISEAGSLSIFDSLIYSLVLENSSKDQIIELREIIEIDILETAARKATDEDIKKAEEILEKFNVSFKNKDYRAAAELDLQFHFTLADMSYNPLLSRIAKTILQLFFSSIEKTLKFYEATKGTSHQTHGKMIEILKKKDYSAIKPVVTESLKGWVNYI